MSIKTTWSTEKTCERCGLCPVAHNRSICAQCRAAIESEALKPNEGHLELLRKTGRDYAGRKL